MEAAISICLTTSTPGSITISISIENLRCSLIRSISEVPLNADIGISITTVSKHFPCTWSIEHTFSCVTTMLFAIIQVQEAKCVRRLFYDSVARLKTLVSAASEDNRY